MINNNKTMGSRKKLGDITPGKAGIGHNVRKVKKDKTMKPSKSRKSFEKLFKLKENNKTVAVDGKVNIEKKRRKALTEVKVNTDSDPSPQQQMKKEKEDFEMEGLCEYEKIRLNNIREREALFAELAIKESKAELTPSQPKPAVKKEKVSKENCEPARKSQRLSGGKVADIVRFSYEYLGGEQIDLDLVNRPRRNYLDLDLVNLDLVNRPRRSLPSSDYLEATKTFVGATERPHGLQKVGEERFKILKVPKKCTIKQFVLSNSLEFRCGRGFYEFTKPEIISYRKEVVLVEKSSGKMFTGRDACRLIGAGSGIRIPPTTFKTWRVFVQSTSHGRNLMANTGFLYDTK